MSFKSQRILMTADTVGGVWTYAMELCRALEARQIEVVLATMGARPTAQQRREAAELPNVELHSSAFKLEWMNEPWADVDAASEWLLSLEERTEPDVVHLNGYTHGQTPFQAPKIVVAHSCVCSWWKAVKNEPAPAEWDLYRARVGRGLRAADLVVAPSRAILKEVEACYQPLSRKMVVYNGRSSEVFTPGTKEEIALAAGRIWDEGKNIAALAQVAPQLACPVYLAGRQNHPEGRRSELQGVHALGQLSTSQLAEWFSRAAIYALPAKYEPFGLSALEAGLAGCALVLGDIPSLREIWGNAAWFVPPHDQKRLAGAINDLIELPRAREHLARKARARALEFTPKRMADGYLRAYAAAAIAADRAERLVAA